MIAPPARTDLRPVNVALGKSAIQSTVSNWSKGLGAEGLVNGDFTQDFGFHTEMEDAPWWRVDLTERYPIEAIVVHNRRGGLQERARTLKVEISDDDEVWTVIHSGLCHFGHDGPIGPLTLPLAGKVWARYVRLSLTERTYFHLSQLEVIVDAIAVKFIETRKVHCLDVVFLAERPESNFHNSYALVSNQTLDGPLIGLELAENGAFGNCTIQYTHAIFLAKRLGLPYIKISENDRSELIRLRERLTVEDVTFIPAGESLPSGGVFLRGFFFDWRPFHRAVGDISPSERHWIIKNIVRRVFNVLPEKFTLKPPDELFIHIRSGDIFKNWINPDVVQPPLSFYTTIVDKLIKSNKVTRVKLVFENRLNPVIDYLESYLVSQQILYATQSGSIDEDIQALINGRFMVFGFGTFAPIICHLSEKVEAVFFFSPGINPGFAAIPTVEQAFEVVDGAGQYIKPGEWQNTPKQRELMVKYPAGNLVFPWSGQQSS
jgi:hypothetical protein